VPRGSTFCFVLVLVVVVVVVVVAESLLKYYCIHQFCSISPCFSNSRRQHNATL
jgi:hypothetical protein